jgi:hypothetical protein
MKEMGFREFVALILLAYFGWAFYNNPTDDTIIGALLMAFAGAWGFYLGGSKTGADTAAKNADTVAAQAQAATDTASGANGAAPQPVTVVNQPDNPIPTEEARP